MDHLLNAEQALCALHARLADAVELAEATGSPLAETLSQCVRDVKLAKWYLAGELTTQQDRDLQAA